MNHKPTTEAIRNAAEVFRMKARDLDRMADEFEKTKEWSIAGEAISCCVNLGGLRLDLLSIRPTRELERELLKTKNL